MNLEGIPRDTSYKIPHRCSKATPSKITLDFFLSTLDVRIKLISQIDVYSSSDGTQQGILGELNATRVEIQNEIQNRCDKQNTIGFFSYLRSANAADVWDDVWNDAYRLQRLVALVEPADSLFLELTRITNQSVIEGIPAADRLKKTLDKAANDLLESPAPPKINGMSS